MLIPILLLAGFIVGIKAALWIQTVLFLLCAGNLVYINRNAGLEGLFALWLWIMFMLGMSLGDGYYYINFYDSTLNTSVMDVIKWFFRP